MCLQWLPKLCIKLDLSLEQAFVKQEFTTEDILQLLDTLWLRVSDTPASPSSRLAFYTTVILGRIGGWRTGGLVRLQYKDVRISLVGFQVCPDILDAMR
jgi:hypothetical protein